MGLSERWSQPVETVREDGLHGGGGGVTLVLTTYLVLHTVFSLLSLSPQVLRAAKCPHHHFHLEVACALGIALKLSLIHI